ncbi:MAG: A24 family peptidase [Thermodesulfobacteriota bacterium]|nr:A24 family peptidase [Thermodesulfobacteriota bacterium]
MILNIPNLVVIILVVVAALIDVRSRRIPNYLTLSGWGAGLMYHVVTGGLEGLMFSFAGLVLGICLLIFFYLLGGVGAADVKLMGAIGAFLGWKGVFIAFLFSAIIGGLYSVAAMAEAGVLRKILKNILETVKGFFLAKSISYEPVNRNLKICYGLPIALGTIFSLWLGDWFFQF